MKHWFHRQAQNIEEETVEALCGLATERLDLLEVCAPWDSPLSNAVERAGGKAYRIGLHNGFDLATKAGFTKALALLRRHRPRYLHVSPPCDPWTSLTNAQQRTPQQTQNLQRKREHGRLILKNCLKLLQVQRQELNGQSSVGDCQGGHGGGEQPLRAASWHEPTVRKMVQICGGTRFRCDGCRFNLRSPRTGVPIQKPWGWFSSMPAMRKELERTCQHGQQHHATLNAKETAQTATYPPPLCRAFAKVLMDDKMREATRYVQTYAAHQEMTAPEESAADEGAVSLDQGSAEDSRGRSSEEPPVSEPEHAPNAEQSPTQSIEELNEGPEQPQEQWHPDKILRKIRVIHSNLGHPSNVVLTRMLKEAGASKQILDRASTYECPQCVQRGHAKPHRTAQVPQAQKKWDIVSVDTFWWHSPHRDGQGNPLEHVVGISFQDEASDYHLASIVRSGTKTQRVIRSEEFREAFARDWLRILPKPASLRFDDEGAFRDSRMIEWLEGQAIKVSVIAGEAAWQVGKHSRHLEVLKENMSLLALELGPDVKAVELLSLCLAAKNELHQIAGYSPNQWCFGQERERIQSFLQFGSHMPTQSLREHEDFETTLQRAERARTTFIKADSRRRILRAARGQARKSEVYQPGELVYFYRKGRNTSKLEAGWHGPARVVAIEKQGDPERNQTQGSVIWIVHATILYRCAPEQLRRVPQSLTATYESIHGKTSPLENVRQAGHQANYRDISQDLQLEPEDSEIHDAEPGSSREFPSPTVRLFGKQTVRHGQGQQGRSDQGSEPEGSRAEAGGADGAGPPGEAEMPQHVSRGAGERDHGEGQVRQENGGDSVCRPPVCRLGLDSPGREPEVHQPDDLHREDAPRKEDHELFWRQAERARREGRVGRGHDAESRAGSERKFPQSTGRSPGGDATAQSSGRAAGTGQHSEPADHLPGHVDEHGGSGAHREHPTPVESTREDAHSGSSVNRARSRTPFGRREEPHRSVMFEDQVDCLKGCEFEELEEVGDIASAVKKKVDQSVPKTLNLGCFQWRQIEPEWEPIPNPVKEPQNAPQETSHESQDLHAYFSKALQNQESVFEITMDVQPRDVHKIKTGGHHTWVMNEKPKKRAEVQFRTLSDEDKLDFLQAMKGELGSYLEHEAVAIARRHNVPSERILGMRWVLTWKALTDEEGMQQGRKAKARLIIKGFQDPDLLALKRDSPTLSTQNRNTILSLAAVHKWKCFIGDIKTAFLNGDKTEYDREIFADPPEEVRKMLNMKPHEICRILKAVYGLLHAPRAWADKLGKELTQQGWIQSKLDPCVWRLYDEHQLLCGLLGIHVDDVLCCGSGDHFEGRVKALRSCFPFGSWKDIQQEPTVFCGSEIKQGLDFSVELNQERYAEGLSEIPISRERREQGQEAVNEAERKLLRATLGALSWRATQSAPWLCASVSYLQGCFKEARVDDLIQINKLVRLQRAYCQVPIRFSSQIEKPVLITYHDASYACRRDGSSQGGLITMLVDRKVLDGKRSAYSPIAWQSRKLPRVCRSSTSAEIQTGSHSMDSHEFTKQILAEWYNPAKIPVQEMDAALGQFPSLVVTDSKNLYDSVVRVETSGLQLEEKRLALEVLSIRERIQAIGVSFRWVDADQQLADGLSKPFVYNDLLQAFQRGVVSIQFDSKFTSAKRKRAWQRNIKSKAQPARDSAYATPIREFDECKS